MQNNACAGGTGALGDRVGCSRPGFIFQIEEERERGKIGQDAVLHLPHVEDWCISRGTGAWVDECHVPLKSCSLQKAPNNVQQWLVLQVCLLICWVITVTSAILCNYSII